MISLLHNMSVLHNQDHIRFPDRGQTVRHNKGGPSLHHMGKGFLDTDLRAGIDGGCSLIQNQHGRQTQHDTGNTQKLFLSLGQASAVLPDVRIVALRQSLDKAMCMRSLRRRNHFFFRSVRFSEHQIFPYRSAYEGIALRDIDEIASRHCSCRDFFLIVVQCDTAAVRTELRQDEPYQCAFADTRLSDDFRTAARREIV